jgi:hypothetical protein
MRFIIITAVLAIASPALAQSIEPTSDPVIGIIAPSNQSNIGSASVNDASNPTTAWSLGLTPKMRKEVNKTAPVQQRCVESQANIKKGDIITFGDCAQLLPDATKIDPKGKKGEDHSPPSTISK